MKKIRVCICGGGLKGSALALYLSLSRKCEVTLVERDQIGSGTTSRNHGRPHSGSSNWQVPLDSPIHQAITLRRAQSSAILGDIPGTIEFSKWGFHIFECEADVEKFKAFAELSRIDYRRHDGLEEQDALWVDPRRSGPILSVPEYSFDPAKLAGRFTAAATKADDGTNIRTRTKVIGVARRRGCWEVQTDGPVFKADVVVNTLSGWAAQIARPEPLREGDPNYQLDAWSLLALDCKAAGIAPLTRTVELLDRLDIKPSAIGHGRWTIIGANVGSIQVEDPDDPRGAMQGRADLHREQESAIFRHGRSVFPPLRRLGRRIKSSLYSFTGTLSRPKGALEGSLAWHNPHEILQHPEAQGYLEVHGGVATTAVLDSLDVAGSVLGLHQEEGKAELREKLLTAVDADSVYPDTARMVWNRFPQNLRPVSFSRPQTRIGYRYAGIPIHSPAST
jgi:glycine/D-amino acid oxidase-like deaminating enzyme